MTVKLEKEGAVGIIVLDRPPANSYDYAFLRAFASAVDDVRVDAEIRAVLDGWCASRESTATAAYTPASRDEPLVAEDAVGATSSSVEALPAL